MLTAGGGVKLKTWLLVSESVLRHAGETEIAGGISARVILRGKSEALQVFGLPEGVAPSLAVVENE